MNSLFKALSELYGWTPEQIGRLTLHQIDIYLDKPKPARRRLSQAEAMALLGRK